MSYMRIFHTKTKQAPARRQHRCPSKQPITALRRKAQNKTPPDHPKTTKAPPAKPPEQAALTHHTPTKEPTKKNQVSTPDRPRHRPDANVYVIHYQVGLFLGSMFRVLVCSQVLCFWVWVLGCSSFFGRFVSGVCFQFLLVFLLVSGGGFFFWGFRGLGLLMVGLVSGGGRGGCWSVLQVGWWVGGFWCRWWA